MSTEHRVESQDQDSDTTVVREHAYWLSPGCVVGGVAGLALLITGLVAILRARIDATLDTPVVVVFGMNQSAAVGLIELVVGGLILLSASSEATRPFMGGLGLLAIVGGIVGVAASDTIRQDLGYTPGTAWFLAACGLVAVIGSAMGAQFIQSRQVRRT